MTSYRFPRTARVRARKDFDRTFKHGRRVALPVLALHYRLDDAAGPALPDDPGEPRLGLAVSRKVDPRAVGRNRIKRALRETFRSHRERLPAGDYVLVARVGAARLPAEALRQAFEQLLQRAGALPRPQAAGTMRAKPSGEAPSSPPGSTSGHPGR
ncbi:ribonuclease P protein component [Lysobacter maris]|uniref:Ribonuclease P protein component n=1 Tax=Marilutibacter maris TaxID=1605891 RepID=A0A508BAT8_9GAMM|nr:ribonuclease P protein component [Lysobacter maris]KAB8198552.1 ribonuclease P protein component [Lysobacter maris]